MTKESKTVSTIRRRKGKEVSLALQKIREENPKQVNLIASEEQLAAAEVEDKCYLFDDRVLGPIMLRRLMFNARSLFLALIAVRFVNALLIQTQFVPDEYWQLLEVAHKMVFGYGYMTWEWREGLRGYSYPLIFASFYKVLAFFGLDSRVMLIKVPRIIQGIMAAWGDLQLYKLSSKLCGRATAQWTLLCQVLSWFMIYCSTRTLSNSTETTLIIAALSYFPWPDCPSKPNDVYKFLTLAALSVIVRPTAALVWILLCSWHLQRVYDSPAFKGVLNVYMLVGSLSLGLSAVVDRIWYGQWTFVQLNFLMFNVVRGGANIYGVQPWHWYFFQGFPAILGTFIFPFVIGAWRAKNKTFLWIILWILATHSFLPHKEFRFIMPALPLAMHFCGVYFESLCAKPALKKFKPMKKIEEKASSGDIDPVDDKGDGNIKSEDKSNSEAGKSLEGLKSSFSDKPTGNTKETNSEEDKSCVASNADVKSEESKEPGPDKTEEEAAIAEIEKSLKSSDVDTLQDKENKDSEQKKDECQLTPEKEELKKELAAGIVQEETSPEMMRDKHHQHNLLKAKWLIIFLMVTNLLPAMYFCLIHQRGTIMVTKFLYDASTKNPSTDVLFLMPCHSTPYYSYLHRNISMRFLTCEPNLQGISNYTEEADRFYEDPKEWLQKEYSKSKRPWPSHIVYFNSLHKEISSTLVQSGYKLCENYFHTHLPEGRVGGSVFISCR